MRFSEVSPSIRTVSYKVSGFGFRATHMQAFSDAYVMRRVLRISDSIKLRFCFFDGITNMLEW